MINFDSLTAWAVASAASFAFLASLAVSGLLLLAAVGSVRKARRQRRHAERALENALAQNAWLVESRAEAQRLADDAITGWAKAVAKLRRARARADFAERSLVEEYDARVETERRLASARKEADFLRTKVMGLELKAEDLASALAIERAFPLVVIVALDNPPESVPANGGEPGPAPTDQPAPVGKVNEPCDRCGKVIDGYRDELCTAGFYDVAPNDSPFSWHNLANPGERIVCDPCMWNDPRYIALYGDGPARSLDPAVPAESDYSH
jgi:hypothetical protein